MFRHKQNVILLGKNVKSAPREEYVKTEEGKVLAKEQFGSREDCNIVCSQ